MEATLKFKLPEELEEYQLKMNAGKYHTALWDISQELRNQRKYDQPLDKTLEKIDDIISDIDL